MIEPEVTAALGRRFLAFLIDASLVVATGLGVGFRQAESFAVIGRDPDDKALVDPAEFETIRTLLDFDLFGRSEILGVPVARLQEFGDSVYVFGSDAYRAGVLAALIAALVLFGAIPMLLGRTLGMMPFGLRIVKTDGSSASIVDHLVRTLVGFVDALPFVLPGLVGFAAATTSSMRQRLGDRFAGTAVVDTRALLAASEPNEVVDLRLQPSAEPIVPEAAAAPDPVADTSDVATSEHTDAAGPTAAPQPATGNRPSPAEALAQAEAAAAQRPATTEPPASSDPGRSTTDSLAAPAAEQRARRNDPLPPPPVHRKTPGERPLGTHNAIDDADDPTAAEAEPAFEEASEVDAPTGSPDRHIASQPSLPLEIDRSDFDPTDLAKTGFDTSITDEAEPDKTSVVDAAAEAAGSLDEPTVGSDLERPDRAWQPPREEVAPVWQPTRLEPAPKEEPKPHDGRSIDDVSVIEPSIGALLADNAGDSDDARTAADERAADAKKGSAKAPVWSEKWRAWMYWDPAKKCWLRHDTETNSWTPVA